MSTDTLEGVKKLMEISLEIGMWRQKAHDLEKENEYLKERIVSLEKILVKP